VCLGVSKIRHDAITKILRDVSAKGLDHSRCSSMVAIDDFAPFFGVELRSAASPDSVVITANTHRLISGLFFVEDRGTQPVKGFERPVQLYQVVQPSGMRGRLQAAAAVRGLTPFVGREDELRLLMNRWERAREGEGQMALIIGEAGIGKSRLLQHFREQLGVHRIAGWKRRLGHSSKTRRSIQLQRCSVSFWRGVATSRTTNNLRNWRPLWALRESSLQKQCH
jgi:hypothetical protein